ncbi:MAG: hypothetical protein IJ305_07435 [Oscillospiraceae bacterium]|nr:hypothetical protein [Oscillospiraceae bacterium]
MKKKIIVLIIVIAVAVCGIIGVGVYFYINRSLKITYIFQKPNSEYYIAHTNSGKIYLTADFDLLAEVEEEEMPIKLSGKLVGYEIMRDDVWGIFVSYPAPIIEVEEIK